MINFFKKIPYNNFRPEVIHQINENKLGGKTVYSEFYDKEKCIFIHTPKTAGTSISKAVYGNDPWHYSVSELEKINKKKFKRYFKFSFVRNPWERMFSTYNYSKKWILMNPHTSIRFMEKYNNFTDFIEFGLSEELVKNHYFFWTYTKYLTKNNNDLEINFCGRFENLESDFQKIRDLIGCNNTLPTLNKSTHENYRDHYSEKTKDKVYKLYKKDIHLFNYDFF